MAKINTVLFYLIIIAGWVGIIFYPPLLIPVLIVSSGFISKFLRRRFIYYGYTYAIIISILWGALFAFGLYSLNKWFDTPTWYVIFTYVFGIQGVGYLGYEKADSYIPIDNSRLSDYYMIGFILSCLVYIVLLVLFHFIF